MNNVTNDKTFNKCMFIHYLLIYFYATTQSEKMRNGKYAIKFKNYKMNQQHISYLKGTKK